MQAELHKKELLGNIAISQVVQACNSFAQEAGTDVTLVLLADELQHLFDGGHPSAALLQEIRCFVDTQGVASFFSGSAYHLVDGLEEAGLSMPEKMPTVRLLPILTRDELNKTMPEWHPKWLSFQVPPASAPDQQRALQTIVFSRTGGVLRNMIQYGPDEQGDVLEPRGEELAILAVLYTHNRTHLEERAVKALPAHATAAEKLAARHVLPPFDPFDQALVSMEMLATACTDDAGATMTPARVHQLADAGWLILSKPDGGGEVASYLRPMHYELMESRQQNLSRLEQAAIHFPEGRTLGEQWEAFYAEYLVLSRALTWNPSAAPNYGRFHHEEQHTEAFFVGHVNTVFKPYPDNIGFGEAPEQRQKCTRPFVHGLSDCSSHCLCMCVCCSDLVYWTITPPTQDQLQAHLDEHPSKRMSKANRKAHLDDRKNPLPHVVHMRFIQVKVGKIIHDVSAASLSTAFAFCAGLVAADTFTQRIIGMTETTVDAAHRDAAIAASVLPAGAAPLKTYSLERSYELVTSRICSAPLQRKLKDHAIELVPAIDPSFWGPRVSRYCSNNKFVLFQ